MARSLQFVDWPGPMMVYYVGIEMAIHDSLVSNATESVCAQTVCSISHVSSPHV